MTCKSHWEKVYATKPADGVSWYQPRAEISLRLIRAAGVPCNAGIIDVGGGASVLVDELLGAGFTAMSVLDLSGAALAKSQARLGANARHVRWIEADITQVELPHHAYDVWHDRAVFHFLTAPGDRRAYVARVLHAVKPGGRVIVASFAEDGPLQCSGLPVVRYSPATLHAELGPSFEMLSHVREDHQTPFGTRQKFIYGHFRKRSLSLSGLA